MTATNNRPTAEPFNNTRAARKLAKKGFNPAWIRSATSREIEIAVIGDDGKVDGVKTYHAWSAACGILDWGGFMSGCDTGVLRPGYESPSACNVR